MNSSWHLVPQHVLLLHKQPLKPYERTSAPFRFLFYNYLTCLGRRIIASWRSNAVTLVTSIPCQSASSPELGTTFPIQLPVHLPGRYLPGRYLPDGPRVQTAQRETQTEFLAVTDTWQVSADGRAITPAPPPKKN